MRQTPVVEQVAADEEGHEGAPAMHHDDEREDPNESPTLAGELGQALTYTPERSPTGTVDRIPGGHAPRIRCLPVSMDPIALLTSAVSATMVSVLLFVLPGAALGPLVLPIAPNPLAWLGRAAGVSLLVVLTGCTVLAWIGRLDVASIVVVTLAVTVVGLALHRPTWRTTAPTRRRRAWWVAALAWDCPGLRPRAHPVIPGREPGSPATELHHLVLPPSRPGDRGPRRVPGSARRNGAPCARSPRTICR